MLKILVGTIFSDVKDYVIRDWYKNVCQFTYPGFDICAIDNSKDKKYYKKIANYFATHCKTSNIKSGTVLHTPRMHNQSEVFMAFSANELRKYFLANDYDILIYNECDVFAVPDIIERLLSYNKPIISALFFTGNKRSSYPMIAQSDLFQDGSKMAIRGYLQAFYELGETEIPTECTSAGLGCTLIYKDIIEKIPFKHDPEFNHHHDTIFARDLWENNIANFYAPIMCRHENQTWNIQRKMIGNQRSK